MVAQLQKSYKGKEIFGTIPQPISTCLEALDKFLNQDNTIVSSTIIAEKRKKDDVSGGVLEVVANVLGDYFQLISKKHFHCCSCLMIPQVSMMLRG
jgi:fatty acid synthase